MMTPLARRLATKLQAARWLLTGDRRLEDEPPDDQEIMTTAPAAVVKICNSSAAHDEPKEKRKLRRDLEDAAAQTNLTTAMHDTLQAQVAQQVQQQNAAAPQLRPTAEGGQSLRNERGSVTERPRAALQHNEVGEELTQAVEQQCEGSRASEGRDAAQEKAPRKWGQLPEHSCGRENSGKCE